MSTSSSLCRGWYHWARVVVVVAAGLAHVACAQFWQFTPFGEGRLDDYRPNASFIVGQSAVFSGPNKDLGTLMRRGMLAAFNEYNRDAVRHGRQGTIGLISYDDGYNGIPARDNTIQLIEADKVLAIVGEVGTPTSQLAKPEAVSRQVPFIGAFTGASFLRTPFDMHVINYRASYIDESAAMVRFFTRSPFFFTRISLFRQDDSFGDAVKEGVVKALLARQLAIYSEGTYAKNTVLVTPGLEHMAKQTNETPPEAIIMVGTYSALSRFVIEAKAREGWSNCCFSTVSFVGPTSFSEYLGTEGNRSNVYVTQTVPFPHDTSIDIVAAYQQAMADWNITTGEDGSPDFTSFEGYLVGAMVVKFVIGAARRLNVKTSAEGNITSLRTELLKECYENGIFEFHGFRLGPYGGYCDQEGTGCHCNQGQRQVYGTMINGSGTFLPHPELDFYFDTCGYQGRQIVEVKFGQSAVLTGPAGQMGLSVQTGIQAAFHEATAVGDNNVIEHFRPVLVSYDDQGDPEIAHHTTTRLIFIDHVFALLGYTGEPSIKRIVDEFLDVTGKIEIPIIGTVSGGDFLRDPRVVGDVMNLRASSADEFVAMVHYFAVVRAFEKISLFRQDDTYGLFAKDHLDMALKAYGLTIYSEGTYKSLYDCNCMSLIDCSCSNVTDGVDNISETGPQAIVTLAGVEHVVEFVKQMVQRDDACDGDCFFATLSVGHDYLLRELNTSALYQNVIITQVVPLYTDIQQELVRKYQEAMQGYLTSQNESSVPHYDFFSLEGYMVGKMAVRVLNRLAIKSRSDFLAKFFETRTIALANDFIIGPYEEPGDASQGCNQGMRAVYLTRIVGGGSQEDSEYQYVDEYPIFRYDDDFCGLTAENIMCYRGRYTSPDGRQGVFWQYYRETQNEICTSCPDGSFTDGRTCVECAAGRYWQAGECKDCDPGTYSSQEGRIGTCDDCPEGRYMREVGSAACAACALGRWRGVDTRPEECIDCLPGKFRGRQTENGCVDCPRSTFSSQYGSTECRSCSTLLLNSVTTSTGGNREEECVCDAGFYGTRYGVATLDDSSPELKGRCIPCVDPGQPGTFRQFGLLCRGGETVNGSSIPGVTSPWLHQHFMVWPPVQNPDELPLEIPVYSCGFSTAHPRFCNVTYAIWDLAAMCKGGREGIACGSCPENHFRIDEGCRECTISWAGGIFRYGVCCPLMAWILYVLLTRGAYDEEEIYEAFSSDDKNSRAVFKRLQSYNDFQRLQRRTPLSAIMYTAHTLRVEVLSVATSIFKRLLIFVQIIGVAMPMFPPLELEPGDEPPPHILRDVVIDLHRILTMESQFMNKFFQLDCVVGSDVKNVCIAELCAPLLVCLWFCFNCVAYKLVVAPIQSLIKLAVKNSVGQLSRLIRKLANMQIRWIFTVNAIGNVMTTLFISFLNLTVSVFVTYAHPKEGKSMQRFPHVLRGSDDWRFMVVLSVLFFMLYCIGTLSVCIWACWRAPTQIVKDKEFATKWEFLIGDFHPAVFWWGVVLLLRDLLWTLWLIVAPNSLIASVLWINGFAYFVAFSYAWRPWGGFYAYLKDCMDTICNVATCLTIPAMSLRSYYSQANVEESQVTMEFVESGALMLPAVAVLIAIIATLYALAYRKRHAVSIFTTSQQLKALLMLMMRASNGEIHTFWAGLNDTDRTKIWYVLDMFYAECHHLQPSHNPMFGRLIKAKEGFKVSDDYQILRKIEQDLLDGKSDMSGLHERALVLWVLEQMIIGYAALCNHRSKNSALTSQSSIRQVGTNAVDLRCLFGELNRNGDGVVEKDEFRQEGRRLAPLCIEDEVDQCFKLLDGEGTGFFNEDRFVVLLKQWTIQRRDNDPDYEKQQIQKRNMLMRLSMKARGGEQTIERWSRTSKVRRQLVYAQRLFRERRLRKSLNGIDADPPQDQLNRSGSHGLPQTDEAQEQLNRSTMPASSEANVFATGSVAEKQTMENQPPGDVVSELSELAESLGEQGEQSSADNGRIQQEISLDDPQASDDMASCTDDTLLTNDLQLSDYMGPVFALPIRSFTGPSGNGHQGMQNGALINQPQGSLTVAEADRRFSNQLAQDVHKKAQLSDWLGPVFGTDRGMPSTQHQDRRWSTQPSRTARGQRRLSDLLGPVFEADRSILPVQEEAHRRPARSVLNARDRYPQAESSPPPQANAGITGLLGPFFLPSAERYRSR